MTIFNSKMKTLLFAGFMILCLLSPLYAQKQGDANNDGQINIVDALLSAQFYVGSNPSPFYQEAADVDCSNTVTIVDALLIAKYYVKAISQFPCSNTPTSTPDPGAGGGAVDFSRNMGVGWNLGNSLEAMGPGNESAWGNPRVTQKLIDAVRKAGFKTLRVPVAWSSFSNSSNFTIKDSWFKRVEEVVNYGLKAGMYVIINEHWDGGWLNHPFYSNQKSLNKRLAIMWKQIANYFKKYDNRLLFAGTNEVMKENDWGEPQQEYVDVQNSFNQTFVDTVRATGGNNANRYLVVQTFNTNLHHGLKYFKTPKDSAKNKLFVEFHYYDPYNFTLNRDGKTLEWPSKSETWANESYVDEFMGKIKNKFVNKGIGLILGEYGVQSRPNVSNFEKQRIRWNQYITRASVKNNIIPVYWDNGFAGEFGFALFDRNSGRQLYPELIKAIVNAGK